MGDARITPETNGVRYGLLTAAALIGYTLIAAVFNFMDRVEASALNLVFLAGGVCLAIAHFKSVRGDSMKYLQGFSTGIITAMVASTALGLFFIIFSAVSPRTLDLQRVSDMFGFDLSVVIVFLAIILTGSMGGMITSLVAMQYFKSPDHKPMQSIE